MGRFNYPLVTNMLAFKKYELQTTFEHKTIEDLHVTSPMVAAMLDVFFSHRAGHFNGNNVRKQTKIGHFSGPIETFQCIKSNRNFDVKI
jgi:hypothetical protein